MEMMTREEAHAALMETPAEEVVETAQEEAPKEETATEEAVDPSEEPEAQEDADQEKTGEAEVEPVAAPDKWDAEDKAWFAEQSPEVQSKILEQEAKREAVLAKARVKASEEARKEVEGQISEVVAVAESLKEWVPKAVAAFQQDYGEPDWKATLERYGPEQTMQMKFEYEERQSQLRQVVEAQKRAEDLARKEYERAEAQKLVELAPELASDAARQKELAGYLLTSGAKQEDLDTVPAWAVVLLNKAFLYDKAQAAAKATPAKPAAPAKPVLKPAAAQSGSSEQRSLDTIRRSFAQTADRGAAHELIMKLGL